MKFETGNAFAHNGKGGRPHGARNRLTVRVFEDMLKHWNEPATEGSPLTKGMAALEIMMREKPNEYVRAVLSIMPKEIAIESVMSDMSDEQLDEIMAKIRDALLTGKAKDEAGDALH
jgi:hypothetical protein